MPWDREWTFLVRVAPGKNCTDPLRRQTTLTLAFSLVNRDSNGFQACCAGWDLCPTADLGRNSAQGGASRHASRALGMLEEGSGFRLQERSPLGRIPPNGKASLRLLPVCFGFFPFLQIWRNGRLAPPFQGCALPLPRLLFKE